MSLIKRGNLWHFAFMHNGRRYRGSCKTSNQRMAEKIEGIMLTRVMEDGKLPGSTRVPTLSEFSERFLAWLTALPADRSPKPATRKYYRIGWHLLESTKLASMKLDQITTDHALAIEVGKSPANTNNALRTLRRMLKKAKEWDLIAATPVVKLVEEHGREHLIEPWMEQKLLTITSEERLTPKGRASRVGWDPFRTILLIMLDSGLRPGEIYRMRWENIHWEQGMIFNPRGKSRKSKRYVPLTERMKSALLPRQSGSREGWVFPSKKAASGHITDREVSKQWLEAKRLSGIPESVVLYCARHRFATDALQATGNIIAVMDAMGHERVDTLRIYSHPELTQIRDAMNKRNGAVQ